MKFLVEETRPETETNSFLAANFADALKERLIARRDTLFATLVLYLSKRESISSTSHYPMNLSSKAEATKFGIELMRRLFKVEDGDDVTEGLAEPAALNLHDRVQLAVGSVRPEVATKMPSNQNSTEFSAEFKYYDRNGVRGPLLERLYDALCSAQPTSTQSERNFSLAASIATKKRAKMEPKKLIAACFLKGYFKNRK